MFVINGNQTFISQIYRVVGHLGEKLDFFSPLGFESKSDFDHKTSNLNPHSIRVSERYLHHKNPIHGRETASIFPFSVETLNQA